MDRGRAGVLARSGEGLPFARRAWSGPNGRTTLPARALVARTGNGVRPDGLRPQRNEPQPEPRVGRVALAEMECHPGTDPAQPQPPARVSPPPHRASTLPNRRSCACARSRNTIALLAVCSPRLVHVFRSRKSPIIMRGRRPRRSRCSSASTTTRPTRTCSRACGRIGACAVSSRTTATSSSTVMRWAGPRATPSWRPPFPTRASTSLPTTEKPGLVRWVLR